MKTVKKDVWIGYEKQEVDVPVIDDIHIKVYEAASKPGALQMCHWHKCESTHCRAGWVVHLAGKQGYDLEQRLSTPGAAELIYEGTPGAAELIYEGTPGAAELIYEVSDTTGLDLADISFYADEKEALEDMKEWAEEEQRIKKEKHGKQ